MSKEINTINTEGQAQGKMTMSKIVAIAAMMIAMSGHGCSNSNDSPSGFLETWLGAVREQASNGFSQGHR